MITTRRNIMEQNQQNLLEMIDRPAFVVKDGIIVACNQPAKNRQIPVGEPIEQFLQDHIHAYANFQGGILYLTLQIGWIQCGATVIRQDDGDIFLLDTDADQAQLRALALAAQQLRIPLSNVMTVADCLFPELQDTTQKEKASQMYRALFQLMRVITNMADAERYTGLDAPSFENTELCCFFREITEKAHTSLEKTGVKLCFSCPETPIFTMVDRERMERAVYNLISNAVKFSCPGDEVAITLSKTGKMACLTVEDHGDGIASHVQATLFHRYMREPAIEDSRFGLGLGMTLIRSVAADHGGTVLLEQSQGTRVAMTMAIRKEIPGTLRTPKLRIGDYAGGRDLGQLEFAETLPPSAYEE